MTARFKLKASGGNYLVLQSGSQPEWTREATGPKLKAVWKRTGLQGRNEHKTTPEAAVHTHHLVFHGLFLQSGRLRWYWAWFSFYNPCSLSIFSPVFGSTEKVTNKVFTKLQAGHFNSSSAKNNTTNGKCVFTYTQHQWKNTMKY